MKLYIIITTGLLFCSYSVECMAKKKSAMSSFWEDGEDDILQNVSKAPFKNESLKNTFITYDKNQIKNLTAFILTQEYGNESGKLETCIEVALHSRPEILGPLSLNLSEQITQLEKVYVNSFAHVAQEGNIEHFLTLIQLPIPKSIQKKSHVAAFEQGFKAQHRNIISTIMDLGFVKKPCSSKVFQACLEQDFQQYREMGMLVIGYSYARQNLEKIMHETTLSPQTKAVFLKLLEALQQNNNQTSTGVSIQGPSAENI